MARMGSKVLVLGAIDTIEGATVEEGIWSEGFLMVRSWKRWIKGRRNPSLFGGWRGHAVW